MSTAAAALATKPAPAVIARHVDDDPFAYAALRQQAIALAQMLSGESWTDFNYHDPGVTLLEALCFALTEGVFSAGQPLVDQLTAPDGRIHYHRLGLHEAEDILPCRPCTAMDYMCYLLDRVPGALQAHAAMPDGDGLWRLGLEVTTAQTTGAAAATARAYWAQRNLGEDISDLPQVLQPRWCSLQLDLSVEGTRAPEEILAELVARCAEHIDAAPRRESLSERLDGGEGDTRQLADVFDGPRVRRGWVSTKSLLADQDQRVYFSDLARLAHAVEGVCEIRSISLSVEGAENDGEALLRRQDNRVLRLRWPDTPSDVADWRIARYGTPIALAIVPLLHRLEDLWRASSRAATEAASMGDVSLARPTGRCVPVEPYVSLFRQLPAIYRERFEARFAGMDAAAADQFRAYLVLLEQWLAHGAAQTDYLRELYTIGAGPRPSYAWQVLGDAHIPGVAALYAATPERIGADVYAPADAALDRRGRVLDHLLALHGEGCEQGSIRPFGWYFDAEAWRRHLFECKRQMVLRIAMLTRDRHGAIDYSRRSLGRRGNTCPLQQRVCLLLAFRHHHDHLLMAPMRQAGLRLAGEQARFATVAVAPAESHPLTLWGAGRGRAVERLGEGLDGAARVLAHLFPALNLQALPPALLRSAVHPDRYYQTGTDMLCVGPDERGRWWPLRLRSARISLPVAAICLHEFACRLQLECEGMHMVEHVLLRPRGNSAVAAKVSDDFYRYRLSAVFPGWTARGRDPSFRRIAEDTLRLSTPAHLRVQAIWLDAGAMARFERCYAAWLDARQAHCAACLPSMTDDAASNAAARYLDGWARLLRWLLLRYQAAGVA